MRGWGGWDGGRGCCVRVCTRAGVPFAAGASPEDLAGRPWGRLPRDARENRPELGERAVDNLGRRGGQWEGWATGQGRVLGRTWKGPGMCTWLSLLAPTWEEIILEHSRVWECISCRGGCCKQGPMLSSESDPSSPKTALRAFLRRFSPPALPWHLVRARTASTRSSDPNLSPELCQQGPDLKL